MSTFDELNSGQGEHSLTYKELEAQVDALTQVRAAEVRLNDKLQAQLAEERELCKTAMAKWREYLKKHQDSEAQLAAIKNLDVETVTYVDKNTRLRVTRLMVDFEALRTALN